MVNVHEGYDGLSELLGSIGGEGIAGGLKGEELNKVKMRMVETRALLILGVEDAQLTYMTDSNPYIIWENLGKVLHAYGFG
ncbi:hypothetical protein H0H87_004851, partial [Tephrocybe sp. NHM501043]